MLNNNNFNNNNNNNNLNILKHFAVPPLAGIHTPPSALIRIFSIDAVCVLFQFSVTCRKDIQHEKEESKGLQPQQEEEYCELLS